MSKRPSPRPPLPPWYSPKALGVSLAAGAVIGLALAVLFIGIGAARVGFAFLLGHSVPPTSSQDLRTFAWFSGASAVAGAFLGALSPVLRGPASGSVAVAIDGAFVMDAGAIGFLWPSRMDVFEWIAYSLTGIFLGLAGAYGYFRKKAA